MTDKPCDCVKECPKCGYKDTWSLEWCADMGGKSTSLTATCNRCGFQEVWETGGGRRQGEKTAQEQKNAECAAALRDLAQRLEDGRTDVERWDVEAELEEDYVSEGWLSKRATGRQLWKFTLWNRRTDLDKPKHEHGT